MAKKLRKNIPSAAIVSGSALKIRAPLLPPKSEEHQAVASRDARGKCPLCGSRVATTEMKVGPVFVRVCEPCSQPVWHVMGLVNWITRR